MAIRFRQFSKFRSPWPDLCNWTFNWKKRLPAFHQLDLRLDKKYYFDKWNLDWYEDIQNAYNFKAEQAPQLIPVRDAEGNIQVNPNDPSRYVLKFIENPAGTILPTVGLIVEF